MKHTLKILCTAVLFAAACMILSAPTAAEPAEPLPEVVRIGLYWGENALEGANLLNAVGEGYDFGYFTKEGQFVELCGTEEKAVSMLKDWSLTYSGGQYVSDGDPDGLRVGCYHIRLGVYDDLEEAETAAAAYEDGYVAMMNGSWCAYCGNYFSLSEAEEAIDEREIFGTAMTGSSRCVTVVATGTDRVLFQYDDGKESSLGVRPRPSEEGERTVTWFRGSRYYGSFQYARLDGGNLTVVNVLSVDDYTCGVVPYEMSPGWPLEALKAQAVTARTFAQIRRGYHAAYGFDLCNTTCCQAYHGVDTAAPDCEEAVRSTSGVYITYKGEPAETFYHSSDGGATENSENVFYEAIPYLRGVEDPYESCVTTGYEHWEYVYTADEITWILSNKGYNCGMIVSVTPTYTEMGNILSLKFNDANGVSWTFSRSRAGSILNSQTYGRTIRSQRFTVTDADAEETTLCVNGSSGVLSDTEELWAVDGGGHVQRIADPGSITILTATGMETVTAGGSGGTVKADRYLISGSGWGHNVGMSQFGAKAMAELGFTYDEILKFYYSGVDVG